MKTIWFKHWCGKKLHWTVGIALEEWSLPLSVHLHVDKSMCITVLCFYMGIEWVSGPDLASRMVEALKK